MPGRIYNELFAIASDQYGFVTQSDAVSAGFSHKALVDLARHGHLRRISRGIYRFNAVPVSTLDQYMEATLWPRPAPGVLSHDTALELHELCDVSPNKVHITVPRLFRTKRQVPSPFLLHRRDLKPRDITHYEGIAVVTARRSILDGIELHLGQELIEQAIDTGQSRGLIRKQEAEELRATTVNDA